MVLMFSPCHSRVFFGFSGCPLTVQKLRCYGELEMPLSLNVSVCMPSNGLAPLSEWFLSMHLPYAPGIGSTSQQPWVEQAGMENGCMDGLVFMLAFFHFPFTGLQWAWSLSHQTQGMGTPWEITFYQCLKSTFQLQNIYFVTWWKNWLMCIKITQTEVFLRFHNRSLFTDEISRPF